MIDTCDKKIRVLYINAIAPRVNNPGAGIFITQRVRALRNLNIQVYPFIIDAKPTLLLKFLKTLVHKGNSPVCNRQLGIVYSTIKIKKGIIGSVLDVLMCGRYYLYRVSHKIAEQTRNECINVIHAHWVIPAGIYAQKLSEVLNIPYVVTCHGSEINYQIKNRLYKKTIIEILEKASCVEFVSKKLCETAISMGYSGKNAVVIPNGIDSSLLCGMQVKKEGGGKVVGFIGNLSAVKRADKLGCIIKKILKAYQAEFHIVGDGELRGTLEEELRDLPVKFFGRVPFSEIGRHLAQMDVLILPSRNEGWGCVIVEAAACGVPSIGSNAGGIPEAIADPRCIVTEGEDFEKRFAERVTQVLNGTIPIDHLELLEKGKMYTWENMQKLSIAEYERITGVK